MPERLVLVDGSSLVFRAWFAIPNTFRTTGGLTTNAIYGFALMFRKLLAGRAPKWGAVILDAPGPTFRELRYPQYKAQRPESPIDLSRQWPWVEKLVQAHDYPLLSVDGVEADDVIGTLTRQAVERGAEVRIISGDKDFAQLVGPQVQVIDTLRDTRWDEEFVRKKWGVRPDQFVDLLALVGDSVDNIPGVAGIGQKGATALLEQYGTLDGVLEHVAELKGRTRATLEENQDIARLSRELARIDTAVQLPLGLDQLELKSPDLSKVEALYRELEFWSLVKERPVAAATSDSAMGTAEEVRQMAGPVAIFAVQDRAVGPVIGAAFACEGRSRYLPAEEVHKLADWLAGPTPKVTHQVRDVLTGLGRVGLGLEACTDTALASFLVDPSLNIPHDLDKVARAFAQVVLAPEKEIRGAGKAERQFSELTPAELSPWANARAEAVLAAWKVLEPRLGDQAAQLGRDLALARVLAGMQLVGIPVDGGDLEVMQKEFEARKAEVEVEIHALAGHPFNVGSTAQLGKVLFEELGLPVIKRTKSDYSTDAEVLEKLAPKHTIAERVLRWRALAKLVNTYTEVLKAAVEPDGRIHATFTQTVGVSGRIITTDPDLQRTPIRTEDGKRIRRAFRAEPGTLLVSADWSQIELRILAHFTEDPLLVEAFEKDLDVHRRTASEIYGVAPEAVTREQRNIGKTVNFATIYGQGATALAQQLDIPAKEAKAAIERYFQVYSGVRTWLDRTVKQAYADGYVSTILGRRRIVHELRSNNFTDRAYGERIAANTPIQGSAADICKLAMLAIDRRIQGMKSRMLLQIHDELVFECPPEELEALTAIVRQEMEHPIPLKVPLKVEIGHGASWAEAH